MRYLLRIIFVLLCITTHASASPTLKGHWYVKSLLDAAPISDMPKEEARRLIVGKKLIFSKSSISLGSDVCKNPKFTETRENTFDLFHQGYHTDPINLRLPEKVIAIYIKCKNDSEIDNLYLSDKDRIIFYWHGFFFEAVRAKR